MGVSALDAVKRLADRFDQDRKVFLSGDQKEEQMSNAKTAYAQESTQRQISATDKAIDTQVRELSGLTEEEIGIVGGEER